jgi:hypothetical protein
MDKVKLKLLVESVGILCHNCKVEFKTITTKDGGILGHCTACDTLKWVISPSLCTYKKLDIKYSSDEKRIDKKDVQKMLREIKNK